MTVENDPFNLLWRYITSIFSHVWSGLAGGSSVLMMLWGTFYSPSPNVKTSLYITAAIAFFWAGFLVWKTEQGRADVQEQKAKELEAAATAQGRLEISFRMGERRFDDRFYRNLHWPTRRLSIGVENVGAKGLTNCQLYFDRISTEDGRLATGIAMAANTFRLSATEVEFIALVSYEERQTTPPTLMELHVASRADGTGGDRLISTSEVHKITLRATAAECEPCVRTFRLWPGRRPDTPNGAGRWCINQEFCTTPLP